MQIYTDLDNFNVLRPVITTGTFDGVHLGHQQILDKVKELAIETNGESVVFTFWPHPRMVISSNELRLFLLNTLDEKIELLENAGIEHLIIYHFTKDFSQLSSNDFISNILVDKIKAKQVVVGFDHHFGKDRTGSLSNLKALSLKHDFGVHQVEAKKNKEQKIGSSVIRKYIETGDVESANLFLGYNYFINGTVTSGTRIGRTIGFPTANLMIENYKLLPSNGVYAVNIDFDGERHVGMLNIGYRPTFHSEPMQKSIEVNIFDFDKDIYNQKLRLSFVKKIREEQKFDDIDALQHQLEADKRNVLGILKQ